MNLPSSSKLDKFLPKTKFYSRVFVNQKLKDEFVKDVKKIIWKYKISEETVSIEKTEKVEEIQIFEVELKQKEIPEKILRVIDRSIPYPILFVIRYGEDWKYVIALKEGGTIKNYYTTDWNEDVDFDFNGINLEKVYQKIIKKLIKNINTENEDFGQAVEKDDKIKTLKQEVVRLENKLKKEKQFNRQVELNKELNSKKQELNNLTQ